MTASNEQKLRLDSREHLLVSAHRLNSLQNRFLGVFL
jgi:hypothetical protein